MLKCKDIKKVANFERAIGLSLALDKELDELVKYYLDLFNEGLLSRNEMLNRMDAIKEIGAVTRP